MSPTNSTVPKGKEQVKKALIEAGIELFSQKGMAAVSVRELADKARVNHSQVFRHFGNKQGLVKAAVEDRLHNTGAYTGNSELESEQMLETSIRAIMQDEQLWRLMTFAALEGEDWIIASIPSPYLKDTSVELEKRMNKGEIYNGVEPAVLLASGFALALGWAVFRKFLMTLAGSQDRNFEELRVQVDKLWDDLLKMK